MGVAAILQITLFSKLPFLTSSVHRVVYNNKTQDYKLPGQRTVLSYKRHYCNVHGIILIAIRSLRKDYVR